MTLAGIMAQVGFDTSRTAGTNGSFIVYVKVYLSGVCRAGRSAPASLLPAMRNANRLSGAVIDVPRRLKLCFTSSEYNSSPAAGLPGFEYTLMPGLSLYMNVRWSGPGISRDVAKSLKIASSAKGLHE